jgi:hypothetical protein
MNCDGHVVLASLSKEWFKSEHRCVLSPLSVVLVVGLWGVTTVVVGSCMIAPHSILAA